jgi:threonine dehydrogenase-like Zn-dependent dehydrogenase
MKGLIVTKDFRLELAGDIEMPRIGDYDALVKTECCCICNGTDREIIAGALPEAGRYPLLLGHEAVGRVVALGPKARRLRIGDRVLRASHPGDCRYASTWGGFCEYGLVSDAEAMREDAAPPAHDVAAVTQQVVPEGISPVAASVMITMKETASALDRIGVKPGDRVALMGTGPVALSIAMLLREMGAASVAIFGRNPLTLELARNAGATLIIDERACGEALAAEESLRGKTDHFIDTVGTLETIRRGRALLAEDGMVSVYGLRSSGGLDIGGGARNWGLRFVQWPVAQAEARCHSRIVQGVLNGRLHPELLVTHRLPIEAYADGFKAIENRRAAKVALLFGEAEG